MSTEQAEQSVIEKEVPGEDRRYKICKCSRCGVIAVCTPGFDFYTTPSSDGWLRCETCMRSDAGIQPGVWVEPGAEDEEAFEKMKERPW